MFDNLIENDSKRVEFLNMKDAKFDRASGNLMIYFGGKVVAILQIKPRCFLLL